MFSRHRLFSLTPYRAVVAACFMLSLSACSSAPPQGNTAETALSSPPPVEGRVPTEYSKVAASSPQTPDWILNIPDDSAGQHFLVALSEYHASEQDARDTAMKNARKEYAQYTGVEVSEVDEIIRAMYGQSSDVFDPTVAGRSKSTQTTDAQVSRIKAKQWYWEKYQAVKAGKVQGQVFKSWVLVTVPVDEYDRVQAWKRERQLKSEQSKKSRELEAAAELERQLRQYQDRLAETKKLASSGEALTALMLVKTEWDRLYATTNQFKNSSELLNTKIPVLEEAQREILGYGAQIRNAIILDSGRFSTINALGAAREYVIPAWAWTKSPGKPLPLANFPLVLTSPTGEVTAKTLTDRNGRAEFRASRLVPGRYRISIDLSSGALATLDKNMAASLQNIETHLTVSATADEFEGAIHNALSQLFAGPSQAPLFAYRVILGPVTYGTTRQGSELSLVVQRQLRQELTRLDGLSVLEPRPRDVNVMAQAVTRGIAIQKTASETDTPAPAIGSSAIQAIIDGAEAALETTYSIMGNVLVFDMTLREAGTDKVLAASVVNVPRTALPQGVEILPALAPPALQPTVAPAVRPGPAIRLQITSHLGDGQTYGEGDTISYFVSTDRDAYLLLIYADAANNLIQILPNRYSGNAFFPAGKYLQIPGNNDRFEFTITAPFGLERVWAFASSRPFPRLKGADLENGLILLDGDLTSLIKTLRQVARDPGVAYGEAQATVTTVAKFN